MRLCKRTDTVFSNFKKPNCLQNAPLAPSILILFMTNEQWTVICDTHTCVLFSAQLKSSTVSFHFSHSHFQTTAGHVITLKWSLRITAPRSAFVPGSSSPCIMILRKPRSLLFVHSMSLPFDHTCCLGKSELETCLRFPVSVNRYRKLRSESSFLSSSSNSSIQCCSPTPRP